MSKLFWSVLMFFSLVITAWSGFLIYNEFQEGNMTNVPLTPVDPSAVQEPLPVETSTSTTTTSVTEVASSTATTSRSESANIEHPKAKYVNGKEVVDFKYVSSQAKKVSLVGEFNKWFRQPMKRDGDNWTVSIPIAPGKYQYVFVVDDGKSGPNGKRVPDPSNEEKSKDGKFSILIINAPAKDK